MISARRVRLGLVLILYLLLLVEGVARLTFAIPALSERLRYGDELSRRRQWIERQSSSETALVYSFDEHDPGLGWRTKPDLRDLPVFGNKVLNTNSAGFRGVREFSPRTGFSGPRILVFGDSFTFGDDVSDRETYSHYLQEKMPNAEVFNLGVHGYGHDQMLLLFNEVGAALQPDIVILGFLRMDMPRNLYAFTSYAKPRFILKGEQLVKTGTPVPTPSETVKHDWRRPRTVDLVMAIAYVLRHKLGLFQPEQITTAILKAFVDAVEGAGAAPVFAYLPSGSAIYSTVELARGEAFLLSFCETEAQVACMTTRPHFVAQRERGVPFKPRGHWGPTGHRVAAGAIHEFLVSRNYVDAVTPAAAAGPMSEATGRPPRSRP